MPHEIERKWILKTLPEGLDQIPTQYERHFLFIQDGLEVRIQRKGDKYEFERKSEENELSRKVEKFQITKEEFELFKTLSIGSIERESYLLDNISIKVYKSDFEGLIRAEVEFETEEEAKNFTPPTWFGEEITDSVLGKDKKLIKLSREDFLKNIEEVAK